MPFVHKSYGIAVGVLWTALLLADQFHPAIPPTNPLQIESVLVDGQSVGLSDGGELRLKPFPKSVTIAFGPASNSNWSPIRLRYKLKGYETNWRRGGSSEMSLTIRFYNESRELISQKIFKVVNDSPNWTGSLATSPLTHHRETFVVPRRASRCTAVISSAGPPDAVGIFVVDDFVLSRISSNSMPQVLLRTPFGGAARTESAPQDALQDWMQDGLRPDMAKIVMLGQAPQTKALAILDDDPLSHAEWRNPLEKAPLVDPGDTLVVEWNELHSVAVANTRTASYQNLPPGNYQFLVREETVLGVPTGVEAEVALFVPPPLWQRSWFLGLAGVAAITISSLGVRYIGSRKMRRSMLRLQQQQALVRERLRIAQDIHDDLGHRVTQISLVSAMAQANSSFPAAAQAEFDRISRMSRELVSALYDTVWAVDPENDNLDAVATFLCQKINELCSQSELKCRLHVVDLPQEILIPSQARHNLSMAVKEAVHNIIKHAQASLVTVHVDFARTTLTISLHDDGCGFDSSAAPAGHGLVNMKRRLEDIGGKCHVESQLGAGTTVRVEFPVQQPDKDLKTAPRPCPPVSQSASQPQDNPIIYEELGRSR